MTTHVLPEATLTAVLTAGDRCDRCGAQAFVRAVLPAGELLFCGHHGRAHAAALARVALRVEDGTAAVNERPSPAAY
jgi:hypothetical protein